MLSPAPQTAYGVSRALFPWARPGDLFLTVSETIANLEVLEARGEVARTESGGTYAFRLVT